VAELKGNSGVQGDDPHRSNVRLASTLQNTVAFGVFLLIVFLIVLVIKRLFLFSVVLVVVIEHVLMFALPSARTLRPKCHLPAHCSHVLLSSS
jgi:hypothetical protein